MYRPFFTPTWFNGWDILFDLFILLVALLIAGYSWKVYRLNRENRYAYFALAFMLVVLGLLFKIFTNATLYFTPIRDVAADVLGPLAGPRLKFSYLFYRSGFFLQMVPLLGAWLLLFFVSQKPRARLRKFYEVSQIALFIYLVLLVSIVSNFKYFVFHLSSMVLLGMIVLNYYNNYLETRNRNTWKVMLAFLFILTANMFFVFVFLAENFYVIGEILMLVGFLLLLFTYMSIRK